MPKPLTQTTGRRKEAVARVRLRPGTGIITVNGRTFDNYFPSETHRMVASEPLRLVSVADVYDVDATIDGGGVSGQAGALRLGIARSLVELDARAADLAQEGRSPHPRRAGEGVEEVRPEEGPQGAAVLQALTAVSLQVRHRRGPRCRQRRAHARARLRAGPRRGAGARYRRAVPRRSRHPCVRSDARGRARGGPRGGRRDGRRPRRAPDPGVAALAAAQKRPAA